MKIRNPAPQYGEEYLQERKTWIGDGEPLSCGKMHSLGRALHDMADRIKAVGLTQETTKAVGVLRLNVNYFLRWKGYQEQVVSSWDGAAQDVLHKLACILNWCCPSSGGKHDPDEITAELRTLAAYAEKLAGGKSEAALGLPCSPEETVEIVGNLRTLAAAVDGSPKGYDVIELAWRIDSALANIYGGLHSEEIGDGRARERTLGDEGLPLAALVVATKNLLREIEERRAPADCGVKLLRLADEVDTRFNRLCEREPTPDGESKPASTGEAQAEPRLNAKSKPGDAGNAMKQSETVKALTSRALVVKDKLLSLKPGEAMRLPQIQEWYETKAELPADTPKTLDEGTWKRVRKELLPHGLKHRANVGYYFEK
jgi:hypothetical protein